MCILPDMWLTNSFSIIQLQFFLSNRLINFRKFPFCLNFDTLKHCNTIYFQVSIIFSLWHLQMSIPLRCRLERALSKARFSWWQQRLSMKLREEMWNEREVDAGKGISGNCCDDQRRALSVHDLRHCFERHRIGKTVQFLRSRWNLDDRHFQ